VAREREPGMTEVTLAADPSAARNEPVSLVPQRCCQ
jgi:hypothetical protein